MSRRKSQKVVIPSSDEESSDDVPISKSVSRRRRSVQASEAEEEEEASEDEVPLTKRKAARPAAKQKAGKARGKAVEKSERAGPSKKSKRTPAPKKAAPRSAGGAPVAEEGGDADSEGDEDDSHLEKMAEFYEMDATEANPQEGGGITEAEEDRLVRNVMRYMLFHQQQKNSVPVKRQELTNIILKNNKGGKAAKNLGGRIIKRVAWEFVKRFGMEMKGIETKRSTIHGEQETGAKVYVLRSLLRSNLRNLSKSLPAQLNQSLAMVLMCIILLAGGKISEDDLESQIAKIGVDLKSRHPTLGKPADQLQTLIQKRYLAERKANGPDDVCKEYAIGDNFHDEVQNDKLSGFIEKIFSHAPMTQAA